MTSRPTWVEIDLGAIKYNITQIKKRVGWGRRGAPRIMAVVKANAYGHGIVEVARILEEERVGYLGVATIDEAVILRKEGIGLPILVLGSVLPDEIDDALKYNIALTLCSKELALAIEKKMKLLGESITVHVKVDTGMGRIGLWHEEAFEFIKMLKRKKCFRLEGIYTHFASASRDCLFTGYQMDAFDQLLKRCAKAGIVIECRHAANSIALIDIKKSYYNLVRPGIIIYGIYPKRSFTKIIKLKPALSLKTRIVYLKDVPAGRSISYGRTFIAERPTTIATLPIGYADGYARILSNRASVLVKGIKARVAGKITMDQTMIDVGHIKGVKLGDEVVLIGTQLGVQMSIEEIARVSKTIPYEIVCSITNRVPRVYMRNS